VLNFSLSIYLYALASKLFFKPKKRKFEAIVKLIFDFLLHKLSAAGIVK